LHADCWQQAAQKAGQCVEVYKKKVPFLIGTTELVDDPGAGLHRYTFVGELLGHLLENQIIATTYQDSKGFHLRTSCFSSLS
jgi:hypothetical protein